MMHRFLLPSQMILKWFDIHNMQSPAAMLEGHITHTECSNQDEEEDDGSEYEVRNVYSNDSFINVDT